MEEKKEYSVVVLDFPMRCGNNRGMQWLEQERPATSLLILVKPMQLKSSLRKKVITGIGDLFMVLAERQLDARVRTLLGDVRVSSAC